MTIHVVSAKEPESVNLAIKPMSKSNIVEIPSELQWGSFWNCTHDRNWKTLKSSYTKNQPVWLFGKGPTFDENFPMKEIEFKAPPVAINDTCIRMPRLPLTITNDFNVFHRLPVEYQSWSIAGVRGNNWPIAQSSGNYALMILAEMGVKDIITVGIDNAGTYGFDYGQGIPGNGTQTDYDGLLKGYNEIIGMYKLNIEKWTP